MRNVNSTLLALAGDELLLVPLPSPRHPAAPHEENIWYSTGHKNYSNVFLLFLTALQISRLLEMQSAGYVVKHRSFWNKEA